MEDRDDSESGSGGNESDDNEDDEYDEEENEVLPDDTLNDSDYEDEVAEELHEREDTPEEVVDAAMMDAFSPATEVIISTFQRQVLPSSLTPTLTIATGQESNTQ